MNRTDVWPDLGLNIIDTPTPEDGQNTMRSFRRLRPLEPKHKQLQLNWMNTNYASEPASYFKSRDWYRRKSKESFVYDSS